MTKNRRNELLLPGHGEKETRPYTRLLLSRAVGRGNNDLGRGNNDLGRGSHDLGRGSHDLGRGSHDLGRGMLKYKLSNP